ncbi:Dynein light chain-related [Carpediemonas membranifera]|uniref:Dynein light chain roadblock n=1 Tax=Carpediemonas membranifera TaxID=201153 RepID=A0A8J6B0N9_9EUKA|nr:Dynein light chain-related [Carpediemonas membranifera]|eukprot:KAG9395895.1 Dynein light chain-related [Carpediemonas membranifera]
MAEVEECIKRISSHKGVQGIVIVNNEGIPIRSTLDNKEGNKYAGLISHLATKARSIITELDPTNELKFFRIRSNKHEIMVSPDKDYLLIVIQDPDSQQT